MIAPTMRSALLPLLLLTLALFGGGCTVVGVRGPVGTPVAGDKAEELLGRWLGPEKMSITVTKSDGVLVATWQEDGRTKEGKFTVTEVPGDIVVCWGQLDEPPFVTPVRLVSGAKSFVLLRPDEKQIKALIAAGTLQAAPESTNSNVFVEPAGVLAALQGKDFWDLSWAVPLLKDDDPPAVTGQPAKPDSR
jgi:hypothetical protein